MSFNFNVEFGVVAEKCLDRLVYDIFLVAPVSVGAYHLAELCAVVSQMVYSESIIA